jgi:hypothetical protein
MRSFGVVLISIGVFALLVFPFQINADIDGDGSDELGAFAVETSGMARGPWMQVYQANGAKVVDLFLATDHEAFQFANIDTAGSGAQDIVVLSRRNSDGATRLEVVDHAGTVVAGEFIAPGGFENWQLFKVNRDGGGVEEIGVGFTRTLDGAAYYQIYRRIGGSLNLLASKNVSSSGFGGHVYRAADFDADGNDEIFIGFERLADGATLYQTWEPQSNTLISARSLTNSNFSNHKFVVGNFDGGVNGDEILIGFEHADGRGFYWVIDELGTTIGLRAVAANTFVNFDWQAINAGATDLVFVGMQRASDNRPLYVLWNPVTGSMVAARFAAGTGFTLLQWVTGNFDGNVGNNHEILAGFLRDSNGATVFQTFTQSGVLVGGGTALGGDFLDPEFVAVRAGATHNLYIGARLSGGAPVIQVWAGNGTLLLGRFIFNDDVI